MIKIDAVAQLVAGSGSGYLISERSLLRGGRSPSPVVVAGGRMPDVADILANKSRIAAVIITGQSPCTTAKDLMSHAFIVLRENEIPVVACSEKSLPFSPKAYITVDQGSIYEGCTDVKAKGEGLIGEYVKAAGNARIKLLGTAWDLAEIRETVNAAGCGIGLFRTEGITALLIPDAREQTKIYKEAIELTRGRELTFRLFDFGGDKRCLCENGAKPAAKAQLDALCAAARGESGALRVLVPNTESVSQLKELREEARRRGCADKISAGAMIETEKGVERARELLGAGGFAALGMRGLADQVGKGERLFIYAEQVIRLAALAGRELTICGLTADDGGMIKRLASAGARRFAIARAGIPAAARALQEADRRREGELLALDAGGIRLRALAAV